MNPFNEFFIRVSSFVRKEMAEILRQPQVGCHAHSWPIFDFVHFRHWL